MFGLFWHRVLNRKIPLVRGFDDMFLAPHSRHTEVPIEDIRACKEITILAESEEAGLFLAMAEWGGRRICCGSSGTRPHYCWTENISGIPIRDFPVNFPGIITKITILPTNLSLCGAPMQTTCTQTG